MPTRRSSGFPRRTSGLSLTALLLVVLAPRAQAADVWLRLDGSIVEPVTSPTREYFGIGGGGFLVGLTPVGPLFDVGGEAGYLYSSRALSSPLPGPASLIALGPVARVHSPRNPKGFSFWAQGGVDYVRTGTLDRVSVVGGAGLSFVFESQRLAIGPRIDYRQVFALHDAGTFPTRDAGLLTFGVAIEFGLGGPPASALPRCPESFTPGQPDDCPGPPPKKMKALDSDGDGTPDSEDQCPTEAGPANLYGCPDPDPDHDGVLGKSDRCPLEPGLAAFAGCPDPNLDRDGDGVPDKVDECPDVKGPAALKGCPDSDGDGIPDRFDKCPTVPGVPEEQGCPRYIHIRVTDERIEILQKIFFAFATTTVMPRSFPLLDEVVRAARDRAPMCLRIEGHTDSVGDKAWNLALSQGRAEAVLGYMVSKGVARSSLEARGYGPTLPIESNATSEGRERNRRVEFVIVPCAGTVRRSP